VRVNWLWLCLLPLPFAAPAEDMAIKLRAIPEHHGERESSPFALANEITGTGRDRITGEVELRARPFGANLVASARSFKREHMPTEDDLILKELYYDTTLAGQRLGFGKKIISWDVGFGFRPLDVIQQEDRRAIFTSTLEGVPYLAWERYGESDAWMLVLANPGHRDKPDERDDGSLALKYYLRTEATDWHIVARISDRHRLESGAAFSRVSGQSTEVHASALYQRRYERHISRLAGQNATLLDVSDPFEPLHYDDGIRALAGFTWTHAGGWSIIAEAWYDASAYTAGEWRNLAELTRAQQALPGAPGVQISDIQGNIAWSARAFATPNLLRENGLLRLSHRGESGDIDPALDILFTPADGGWVATASLAYEGNRLRVDAGYRVFGGPRNAAYRLLPEDRVAYAAFQVSF
jgi:hypothetical protein